MQYSNVCLHAYGYVLPPIVLSSADIETRLRSVYERLKLPEGRLELMTGIKERRFWNPGTRPSDGAAKAGEQALQRSGLAREDMGCLIFSSVSRDMMEPATATFVHHHLRLPSACQVFDLSNACLGFLNGMIMLANMIELGQVKAGMVVAGETAESLVESTLNHMVEDSSLTRKNIKHSFASLTIGSGAVAVVMSGKDFADSGHSMRGGACIANTQYNSLCQGGQNSEQGTLMSTDSEQLLHKGIETAKACWGQFQEVLGWSADRVHRFFCHQVGRAHANLLFSELELDLKKNFETLPILGNVGSVSAPITMAMGVEQGLLAPGQCAAMLGIGSGINSLMLGIEW